MDDLLATISFSLITFTNSWSKGPIDLYILNEIYSVILVLLPIVMNYVVKSMVKPEGDISLIKFDNTFNWRKNE